VVRVLCTGLSVLRERKEQDMDTPEPVMRNGIMTYAVPELGLSDCTHCCMRDEISTRCRWNTSSTVKGCSEPRLIFIEATPEAYAAYITQRIQKELQP
jgi:hypothetical protein